MQEDRVVKRFAPYAILVACWFVYAYPLLVEADRNLYYHEAGAFDVPGRIHAARMMRDGLWPWWTKHLMCGFPLFSESQIGALYPGFILYWFSPTPKANDAFVALHLLVMTLGMYAWLRGRGVDSWVALLVAAPFIDGWEIQGLTEVPGKTVAMALTPWSFRLIDRALEGDRRAPWWGALVNAGIFLGGDHMLGNALLTLQGLYLFRQVGAGRGRNPLALAMPLFGAAFLIATAQWWPTLRFLAESTRNDPDAEWADKASNLKSFADAWPFIAQRLQGFSVIAALGLIVLRPLREKLFWIAAWLVGTSLGSEWNIGLAFKYVPIYRYFRWPEYYLYWSVLATSVFQAHGFDGILRAARVFFQRQGAVLPRIVLAAAGVLYLSMTVRTAGLRPILSRDLMWNDPVAPLAKEVVGNPHVRVHHPDGVYAHQYVLKDFSQEAHRRAWSILAPNVNLMSETQVTSVYGAMAGSARPRNLVDLLALSHYEPVVARHFLESAAVTHVARLTPFVCPGLETLSTDPAWVYRVINPLPRARMVHQTVVLPTESERLKWYADPEADFSTTAIVETPIELHSAPDRPAGIAWRWDEHQSQALDVDTEQKGMLVLADRWSPDIVAWLDGKPTTIHRVNHAFRGIVIPEGLHRVALAYDARHHFRGMSVSLAALAFVLVLLLPMSAGRCARVGLVASLAAGWLGWLTLPTPLSPRAPFPEREGLLVAPSPPAIPEGFHADGWSLTAPPDTSAALTFSTPDSLSLTLKARQSGAPTKAVLERRLTPTEMNGVYVVELDLEATSPGSLSIAIDRLGGNGAAVASRDVDFNASKTHVCFAFTSPLELNHPAMRLAIAAGEGAFRIHRASFHSSGWRVVAKGDARVTPSCIEPGAITYSIEPGSNGRPEDVVIERPISLRQGEEQWFKLASKAHRPGPVAAVITDSTDRQRILALNEHWRNKREWERRRLLIRPSVTADARLALVIGASTDVSLKDVQFEPVRVAAPGLPWTLDRHLGAQGTLIVEDRDGLRWQTSDGVRTLVYWGDDESLRVEPNTKVGEPAWGLHLTHSPVAVQKGRKSKLAFEARSDRSRSLIVAVSESTKPWTNRGLYEEVPLEGDWKAFHFEFDATESDPAARIEFHLSGDSPLELRKFRWLPSK